MACGAPPRTVVNPKGSSNGALPEPGSALVGKDDMTKTQRTKLRDGSIVLIRPVEPEDSDLLAEGFERLSSRSRRLRFLSGRSRLSRADLAYFTRVDHHDHEAIGALEPDNGRGLGIARYIRSSQEPACAEVAVTVVDDWQHRGLGSELLARVTQRAREEGIGRFTALVSADNLAVSALLRDSGAAVREVCHEGGETEYLIDLPHQGLGQDLRKLLRAFAELATPPRHE